MKILKNKKKKITLQNCKNLLLENNNLNLKKKKKNIINYQKKNKIYYSYSISSYLTKIILDKKYIYTNINTNKYIL